MISLLKMMRQMWRRPEKETWRAGAFGTREARGGQETDD